MACMHKLGAVIPPRTSPVELPDRRARDYVSIFSITQIHSCSGCSSLSSLGFSLLSCSLTCASVPPCSLHDTLYSRELFVQTAAASLSAPGGFVKLCENTGCIEDGLKPDNIGNVKLMACAGLSATRSATKREAKDFWSDAGARGRS